MRRWGWRRMAALYVSVLVMIACEPTLSLPLTSPATLEPTLVLRTAPSSSETPSAPQTTTSPTTSRFSHTQAPTTTPHYYTVMSGDTLAQIAIRFNVTVSALQAANGDLPADQVLPGQVILIPPSNSLSPTGTLRLLPTMTPLPLMLPPPTCYATPADELFCLGWVPNSLAMPLRDVVVRVTLRGPAGESRAERAVALLQSVVLAENGGPYAVHFRSPPPFDSADVVLLSAEDATNAVAEVVPLTVRDDYHLFEDEVIRVQATIFYEGHDAARDVLVVVALLDADGHVTGYRAWRPETTLTPGETLAIDLPVIPLGPGTVAHWVYAEGRALPADS